jgi:hypothetical protein
MAVSCNPELIEKPPNIPRMTTALASTGFCGLCGKAEPAKSLDGAGPSEAKCRVCL